MVEISYVLLMGDGYLSFQTVLFLMREMKYGLKHSVFAEIA